MKRFFLLILLFPVVSFAEDRLIGQYYRMQSDYNRFMYGVCIDVSPGGEQTYSDNNRFDVNGVSITNIGPYRAQSGIYIDGRSPKYPIKNGGDNAQLYGWENLIELDGSARFGISFQQTCGIGIDMARATFATAAIRFRTGQLFDFGSSNAWSDPSGKMNFGTDLKIYGNLFSGAVFFGSNQGLLYDAGDGNIYLRTGKYGSEKFFGFLSNGNLRPASNSIPKASNYPGVPGEEATDANYIYRCVGVNKWKRVELKDF